MLYKEILGDNANSWIDRGYAIPSDIAPTYRLHLKLMNKSCQEIIPTSWLNVYKMCVYIFVVFIICAVILVIAFALKVFI